MEKKQNRGKFHDRQVILLWFFDLTQTLAFEKKQLGPTHTLTLTCNSGWNVQFVFAAPKPRPISPRFSIHRISRTKRQLCRVSAPKSGEIYLKRLDLDSGWQELTGLEDWLELGAEPHIRVGSDWVFVPLIYSATQNDESMIPAWEIRSSRCLTHHQRRWQRWPAPNTPHSIANSDKQITGLTFAEEERLVEK